MTDVRALFLTPFGMSSSTLKSLIVSLAMCFELWHFHSRLKEHKTYIDHLSLFEWENVLLSSS